MRTNKLRNRRLAMAATILSLVSATACSNSTPTTEVAPPIIVPIVETETPKPIVETAKPTPTQTTTAAQPTPIAIDPYLRYETESQTAARTAAAEFLAKHPYSRSGLVQVLKAADFSAADADYAVDADWYQQSVKDAQNYYALGNDDGNKLYDLLVADGFNAAQAKFGLAAVGLTYTPPTQTPSTLPAPAPTRTQTPSTLPAKPPTQKPSTLPAKPPLQGVQPSVRPLPTPVPYPTVTPGDLLPTPAPYPTVTPGDLLPTPAPYPTVTPDELLPYPDDGYSTGDVYPCTEGSLIWPTCDPDYVE